LKPFEIIEIPAIDQLTFFFKDVGAVKVNIILGSTVAENAAVLVPMVVNGAAVEVVDGWASAEMMAKAKTMVIKLMAAAKVQAEAIVAEAKVKILDTNRSNTPDSR
jgi:hypothetical protein